MKIFTSFTLFFSVVSAGFSQNINPVVPYIPDVMNKIQILQNDSRVLTFSADTFTNFPGYPKNLSGTSFEGGIYCNMDADPEFEILYCAGSTVYALNLDGTNVPGWPQTVSGGIQGAPAFGDIDGDGQGEVVLGTSSGTSSGFIYAWHRDGTLLSGYPINHGYTTRTIVLGDVNNDGTMEIITQKRLTNSGEVYVYNGNGTVRTGWPKTINHVPASSCAVGDITGDGYPEIIAESYTSLYAWDKDGNLLAGFPFVQPANDVNSYSSPVLVDLTGDNIREIIWGTHILGSGTGHVYALKNDGTMVSGWPKSTNYWIYSPPAAGYINNDNIIDIAIGDGGGTISGSPVMSLYAWDRNGNNLTGFPVSGLWSINNQPSLGDIDNDNMTEIIIDDNTTVGGLGKYLAFNHDGTPVSGWPIATQGTTFFYMPILFDVNRDNILDISGGASGSGTSTIYLWNTGMNYNPSKIYNPVWQYNTRHNGVFGDVSLTGIVPVVNETPSEFQLHQNYPNPFNPVTKIRFSIPLGETHSNSSLRVYDILGRDVTTLANEQLKPGTYEVEWNASGYPSGVYYYTLTSADFKQTRKMVLIK